MLNADEIDRLLSGFETVGECWLWQRSTDSSGYGGIRIKGKKKYAHRLMYELLNGPIPPGLEIRHSCDTPACGNPVHLSSGTSQDNRDDCVKKKRHNLGEKNGNSTLNERIVREIRDLGNSGLFTLNVIGQWYGITGQTVYKIKAGLSWQHVT